MEMEFTDEERKWMALKISETIYARQQQINALQDGIERHYIPEDRMTDINRLNKEKTMLAGLFVKIIGDNTKGA